MSSPFAGVKQPPSGRVKIVSERGEIVELLYPDPMGSPIDRAGGVGGWQTSDRIGLAPSSWFQAGTLGTATANLMFDLGMQPGASIESRLATLRGMGRRGKDRSAPPGLKLFGDAPTMRSQLWRLDNVEDGANFSRNGKLAQMALTLSLTELIRATGIGEITVGTTRDTPTRPRVRMITVVAGQTLRSIAVQELGASSDYTQIQGWNKSVAKTDPDTDLRPGSKLVLK